MKKKAIVLLTVIVCCAILFVLFPYVFHTDAATQIDDLNQQLYRLPFDTTTEYLESNGFFNLTDIQPERQGHINTLFSSGDGVLKAFYLTDDGPVIRIFARDEKTGYIIINKYYVQRGVAEDTGYALEAHIEEVSLDDGIVEVWLRGTVKNMPQSNDTGYEILIYRYSK